MTPTDREREPLTTEALDALVRELLCERDRRWSGMVESAKETWRKNAHHGPDYQFALKVAQAAAQAERERCAKVMCWYCSAGYPLKDGTHSSPDHPTWETGCRAAAIRVSREQGGGE